MIIYMTAVCISVLPLSSAQSGRERYVFFSFPHIAIDSQVGRDYACGCLEYVS